MSEVNDRLPPDILDVPVQALRDAQVSPGPSEELIAATVAGVNNHLAGTQLCERERRRKRRKWIMRAIKYGTLSTALAAAVAVVVVFWSPGGSAADELKTAVRKAEEAKTSRMRIELDAGDDGKMTSKMYYDQGKLRSEVEPAGLVVIINGKARNKGIMLLKTAKTYRVLDPEKDELVKQVTQSVKKSFDQFKLPGDDKVRGLEDEYLDGRKTKVYEIKDVAVPDMKAKADLKMWIDPKTNLPVQSRVISSFGDKTITAVATYLGFNEDLDPKLFDTVVPKGFKEMEKPKKKDK